ncbi:MAG: HD domain-containing protein, partial [Deltaproteobacteria bacterium]|nr:HD domain-containing protein [Deltaproteobacteria bacterium]
MQLTIRGTLMLQTRPSSLVADKMNQVLGRYVKNVPPEKMSAHYQNAPVILLKSISQDAGQKIADMLTDAGASVSFVPESALKLQTGVITDHHGPIEKALSTTTSQIETEIESSPQPSQPVHESFQRKGKTHTSLLQKIEAVNRELWLILSIIFILGVMNYLVSATRIMMGLYVLPTIFSAYFYGRRHATLTAIACILVVVLFAYYNPECLVAASNIKELRGPWYDVFCWGAILIVTAYAIGTLQERSQQQVQELRRTYRGMIVILRHFISKDKYTENHCYRVSIYSAKIAYYMKMNESQIEDVRSAALLHDLGKLDISRELLYKAARLNHEEYGGMIKHVDQGVDILTDADTPLNRIIPIILSHHEHHDGSGYLGSMGNDIPIEARVIAVADVYDALASDRPYRKALPPIEVKEQ